MEGVERLRRFLSRHGVDAEIISVDRAATSREASMSLGTDVSNIAKTVVMVSDSGDVVAVVIRADHRIRQKTLARMLGYRRLRLAKPEEVVESTGYAPGAVPPVGLKAGVRVIVDGELLSMEKVFAGGGSEKTLLKISPRDIVKLSGAIVMNVPKSERA